MKEIRVDQLWIDTNPSNKKDDLLIVSPMHNMRHALYHMNGLAEDSHKIIERNKIIRLHETFRNEKNNNYNHQYMSTLYGLLFNNEKRYHIKRNKMRLGHSHYQPIIEIDSIKEKQGTQPLKNNKTLPMKYFNKTPLGTGVILTHIPMVLSQTLRKGHMKSYDKSCNESIIIPNKTNSKIKLDRKTKEKFHQMSVEKSKWLNIMHTSDEYEKNELYNRQEKLMKKMEWRRPVDVKYSLMNECNTYRNSYRDYMPRITVYNMNTSSTQGRKNEKVFNLRKKI